MIDIASDGKLEEVESDDDEMNEDELQIIDLPPSIPIKQEG